MAGMLLILLGMLAGCGSDNKSEGSGVETVTSSQNAGVAITPAESGERIFTDSVGRDVTLPAQIDRVAVTGPMAQIVLFALCPEKLVGIAENWDKSAEKYIATEYYNLPYLGRLYGGKGDLNLETLLAVQPQIVIDVGEAKDSIVEDLNGLQEQTGLPFVHITTTTESMGEAYRILGQLLGCEERAEILADYCESTLQRITELTKDREKVKLLYCLGEDGLHVIAKDSYHGEIIDLLTDNLAVIQNPSSKGTGNEVDLEQILVWDPEYIIFAPDSIYATVAQDENWQQVKAIAKGNYCEAPFGPYNWMGFPPSVQRYLGMLWMGKVLYPEKADYDLYEEIKTYFDLFYHSSLSREQYEELVRNSLQ